MPDNASVRTTRREHLYLSVSRKFRAAGVHGSPRWGGHESESRAGFVLPGFYGTNRANSMSVLSGRKGWQSHELLLPGEKIWHDRV